MEGAGHRVRPRHPPRPEPPAEVIKVPRAREPGGGRLTTTGSRSSTPRLLTATASNSGDLPLARFRLALLCAGLLWSLGGVFIKSLPVSALGITLYRSLFAAFCLLPLLRGRRLPKFKDTAVAVVLYTLLLALYISATQGTTAANAIFLQYTAPVYALLLGPRFFGDPLRREDAWAVTVAMAGMALLFFGNFHGGQRLPLLMGAGSGLMFGLFMLWLRRLRHEDPVAVTATNNCGVALVAVILVAVTRPSELTLIPRAFHGGADLHAAILLLLMGGIQIAAPYVLFSYGLRRVPAVEAGLLALVEPVLNPVWVMIGIREAPTWPTLAGGALIIAALAARYTLFRPRVADRPTRH
jgi:DME family drug/metabolite transporter